MTTDSHPVLNETHVRGVSPGADPGIGTGDTNELRTCQGVRPEYTGCLLSFER